MKKRTANRPTIRSFVFLFVLDADQVAVEATNSYGRTINEVLRESRICRNALGALLDLSAQKWVTYLQHASDGTLPRHGNHGKVTGKQKKFEEEVVPKLEASFDGLKQLALRKQSATVSTTVGCHL